jgi:UDP-N-acetylglucosamine--N-acetylmuramyl-(pentapeptide) pyrophosphoryl-undecaprenol N-acetylglucosamine transferase
VRLLIAGGGTGGHLYPGIAVAEELLARQGDHRVLFAGTNRGLEARVLPGLGLPFEEVRSAGLVGGGLGRKLRGLGLLGLGFLDAGRLLRRFRPDTCLGVGGYVSFPVVALACLLAIPTALQEQNARPGLTNRLLARRVRRVYAGDEAAARELPEGKTVVTGNPLRRAFASGFEYEAPELSARRLLVLGGSQGARALNEILPGAVARLSGVEVLHQAGRGNGEAVAARYAGLPGVRVVDFIEDVASAYAWAHLVVARAGALTLAELAAAGRPALLVPYPFAAGNHQEANARAAEARGAAISVPERELSAIGLAAALAELFGAPDRLRAMAGAARGASRPNAAREIVDDLLRLAELRSPRTGGS